MISSVGQSPTEPLVLGRRHGGREATERSEASPLPPAEVRGTPQVPDRGDHGQHADLRVGPGAWGQRPQITITNRNSNNETQNPPPQRG